MVTARAAATFEPVGRSAGAARSFVRDALLGWGLPEVVDDAVVLVSELVTNAVVHAGTAAEVCCLREDGTVRIEVTDHHPERGLPSFADVPVTASERYADPDGEGGRGLLMCSALAERWGVEYSAGRKTVWFRLALPAHVAGTRYAVPATPGGELPSSTGPVHVAVVRLDDDGRVLAWNPDAEALFRHPADAVLGRPWADLAVWPQGPGTGLGLAATLRLARWEGSYGLRHAEGGTVEVYGLQVRIRDTDGTPSTLCLLVLDTDRAVLRSPPAPCPATRPTRPPAGSTCSPAPPPPTTSTACCSAPSNAPATCSTPTPPTSCSPPRTRPSSRSAPPPASPPATAGTAASPSRPATATTPPGCPPSTRTSPPARPASPCSPAAACAPCSPSRSRSRAG